MKLIKQTSPTTCGQCCIAMLLDTDEADAIKMVGHSDITSDISMVLILNNRFTMGEPPNDVLALVKHKEPNGVREHWTVIDHGQIFDPACKKKLWPAYKYLPIS